MQKTRIRPGTVDATVGARPGLGAADPNATSGHTRRITGINHQPDIYAVPSQPVDGCQYFVVGDIAFIKLPSAPNGGVGGQPNFFQSVGLAGTIRSAALPSVAGKV